MFATRRFAKSLSQRFAVSVRQGKITKGVVLAGLKRVMSSHLFLSDEGGPTLAFGSTLTF